MPRTPKITNREGWLEAAVAALRPDFDAIDFPLPEKIAVSCGFPSKSATSSKRRRIGECWHKSASDGETPHVFITPLLDDPVEVLATLAHELVHAGGAMSHKAEFARPAKALGLEGPMTATHAGEALAERLRKLADKLGPYPHSKIKVSSLAKPQTTRMLKVECFECGCILRMTRQWLTDAGTPTCGCGSEMGESV